MLFRIFRQRHSLWWPEHTLASRVWFKVRERCHEYDDYDNGSKWVSKNSHQGWIWGKWSPIAWSHHFYLKLFDRVWLWRPHIVIGMYGPERVLAQRWVVATLVARVESQLCWLVYRVIDSGVSSDFYVGVCHVNRNKITKKIKIKIKKITRSGNELWKTRSESKYNRITCGIWHLAFGMLRKRVIQVHLETIFNDLGYTERADTHLICSFGMVFDVILTLFRCSEERGFPIRFILWSELGGFCGGDCLWDQKIWTPFLWPSKIEPREARITLIKNGESTIVYMVG